MAKYGLTSKGPNIKRLDVILSEMHEDMSERLGVNTQQNPQSFLNHHFTNVADALATLWEFGESIYYSMYPSTAEGVNLDNAAQFGGVTRGAAKKSYYPIHCKGYDGTVLSAGTTLASNTNPPIYLSVTESKSITRQSFNRAEIKPIIEPNNGIYTIVIDDKLYSYSANSGDVLAVLNGLMSQFESSEFEVSVNKTNLVLNIEAKSVESSHEMILSDNLTTATVTSVITFGTVEKGDIFLPNGAITEITRSDAGLLEVINLCTYTAGNAAESDEELRKSYVDKIYRRSSMMLESIRSGILSNVQGVISVAAYENDTHEYDDYGRPPHSIEIVVEGGDNKLIAQQILASKAGGINTFGDVLVNVPGYYDEDIPIRFNRPQEVYVWMEITLSLKRNETLPVNYSQIIKDIITENIGGLNAGQDVVPQEFVSDIHDSCSGISYVDIRLASTTDSSFVPEDYPDRSVYITARQRAVTGAEKIEVHINA